ncbi:hypothetical protein [Phocaeicola abscessus]|uniref:hypothetical protein n=1 Tax=Phocaeicola abscessus TaxID=555313 RepID=UPI0028E60D75|nr:hypothetical protein [Phocaeicola abscessus]
MNSMNTVYPAGHWRLRNNGATRLLAASTRKARRGEREADIVRTVWIICVFRLMTGQ